MEKIGENINVLVISNNCFSKTKNNGKTLASFFRDWDSINISQLYFSSEIPDDEYYMNYFRISDKDVLYNCITKRKTCGKRVDLKKQEAYSQDKKKIIVINELTLLIREYFWRKCEWETKELNDWILYNQPNIVFFCAGDSIFAYNIAMRIVDKYHLKLAIYFTDDYIISKKSTSPFFKVRRSLLKDKMSESIKTCDAFFTISPKMREAYKKVFNKESHLLLNSTNLHSENKNDQSKEDFILVYAGNLCYGRERIIAYLARAIKEYNNKYYPRKVKLKIFSGEKVSKKTIRRITVNDTSEFCGSLDKDELKKQLNNCNMVVHVESFSKREKNITRFSLSTKISELMSLEKCILAIGPEDIGSMEYLASSAYCINDLKFLKQKIENILNNTEEQNILAHKAYKKYLTDLENKKNEFKTLLTKIVN